jgi:Zn-dependent protease
MEISVIIAQVAVLLFALSFHEAAHAWSAYRLGDPTAKDLGRITLNPLAHIDPFMTILFPALLIMAGLPPFGAAKPVPVDTRYLRDPRRDHAWIAAAGPISNIILALGSAFLLRILLYDLAAVRAVVPAEVLYWVLLLLQASLLINLLLATFNMIPIPPLDGSWILSALLPGPVAAFYRQLQPYGFVILAALIWTGALSVVFRPVIAFGMALAGR